jgi:hypothetical protein
MLQMESRLPQAFRRMLRIFVREHGSIRNAPFRNLKMSASHFGFNFSRPLAQGFDSGKDFGSVGHFGFPFVCGFIIARIFRALQAYP